MIKAGFQIVGGIVLFGAAIENWDWSLMAFLFLVIGPFMFLAGVANALIWFAAQVAGPETR